MFRSVSRWAIFVWNVFSVVGPPGSGPWQTVYSTALIASSVYVFYYTPQTVCTLEGNCDGSLATMMKGMYARVVALITLASRLAIVTKGGSALSAYKERIDRFHAHTPMTPAEAAALKRTSQLVMLCSTLLVVPVNALRLWILFNVARSTVVVVATVYVQNFSMFCIETHFTVLCFVLYQKLVGINRDLTALKVNTVVRNRYPFVSGRTGHRYGDVRNAREYNEQILRSLAAGHPMCHYVIGLKVKHQLVRRAVGDLNGVFGVHLGLSLCSLCLYAMFDTYYNILNLRSFSKSEILIYGWMLQYTARFGIVTVLAHLTSKQANKSKILITDINNRYLDDSTKEELQIFLNQISSCAIEFTACDFFTLNTHLITSTIAAGTTYLVILLQFNSSKD